MTEDEAKTKWCPFVRQVAVVSRDEGSCATANRDGREHYGVDNVNCIASACMAWRFGPNTADRQEWVSFSEPKVLPGQTASSSGEWRDLPEGLRNGFCGLAGAPR